MGIERLDSGGDKYIKRMETHTIAIGMPEEVIRNHIISYLPKIILNVCKSAYIYTHKINEIFSSGWPIILPKVKGHLTKTHMRIALLRCW